MIQSSKPRSLIREQQLVQFEVGERILEGVIEAIFVRGVSDPLVRVLANDGRPFLRLISELKLIEGRERNVRKA